MTTTRSILAGLAVAFALCGCLSPERAVREARETGSAIAGEYIEKVTGRTNEFTIARPADRLRNRLLAEQRVRQPAPRVFPRPSPEREPEPSVPVLKHSVWRQPYCRMCSEPSNNLQA